MNWLTTPKYRTTPDRRELLTRTFIIHQDLRKNP